MRIILSALLIFGLATARARPAFGDIPEEIVPVLDYVDANAKAIWVDPSSADPTFLRVDLTDPSTDAITHYWNLAYVAVYSQDYRRWFDILWSVTTLRLDRETQDGKLYFFVNRESSPVISDDEEIERKLAEERFAPVSIPRLDTSSFEIEFTHPMNLSGIPNREGCFLNATVTLLLCARKDPAPNPATKLSEDLIHIDVYRPPVNP